MNRVFDYFHNAELPALTLCDPNRRELSALPLAYNIKNTLKYNAISELEFDYPQSANKTDAIDPAYDILKGKMVILVEDIGYYIIREAPEAETGKVPIKHVSCMSLESELLSRRLTGFTGEYNFVELLEKIVTLIPSWSIGTIDESLTDLSRNFETNNSTLYNFMVKDMEKAFGCVFEFDTFTKTISVRSSVIPGANTNIFLSFDNLIKSTEFKEITEELTTCLYCYGKEDLDIRNVNPLGTTAIYNFDYFKTTFWMSQTLIDVLNTWEAAVDAQHDTYSDTLAILEQYNIDMLDKKAVLSDLLGALTSMLSIREARKAQTPPLSTEEIDEQIEAQEVLIASQQIDIATLQGQMDVLQTTLNKIVHSLYFTSRISYTAFKDDVYSLEKTIKGLQADWANVYNETSLYPNFNIDLLNATKEDIAIAFDTALNKRVVLYNYLDAGFSTYPASGIELATLQSYINDVIDELEWIYGSLQQLIPGTLITQNLYDINVSLKGYLEIIEYSGNMSDAQYEELSTYIYENTYTNDNIIITEIMTPIEVQAQAEKLFVQSQGVLEKAAVPRYTFSGDISNFTNLENYSNFTSELDLGKVINIRKRDNYTIEAALLELSITYDKPTEFSLTFSNSFRLDTSAFIYADILGEAAQLGSSVSGAGGIGESSFGGWTVTAGGISTPNASISSNNYISFGTPPPTGYGDNLGAWLGYDGAPKLSLYSNSDNFLKWDGTRLLASTPSFILDSYGKVSIINGSISFGNPPPISNTNGTGLWIDETGLYGLNADVQQFAILSEDGSATFGGGAGILNADGLTLELPVAGIIQDQSAIKWISPTYGQGFSIGSYIESGAMEITSEIMGVATDSDVPNSTLTIGAESESGNKNAFITLWAWDDSPGYEKIDLSASEINLFGELVLDTPLTVPYGGTGASTLEGLVIGNDTDPFTAIKPSAAGSMVYTHLDGSIYWETLSAGNRYNVLTMGESEPYWSNFLLYGTAGGGTNFAVSNTKTLTLTATDNYNLTIPATGTAALLAIANIFTAAQTINVNSATALLVEQDGVKDNTLIVDTTNGYVGIGGTPITSLTIKETSTSSPRGVLSMQFSSTTDGARVGFAKARGTITAPATVVTGDTLGRLMFRGYDGSNYLEMASIEAVSTGTIATTQIPTYLALSTATDTTPSVLTERMRIDSAGNVGIGTASPTQKLDVLGQGILLGGDFSAATSRTNSTTKWARIDVPHYTNAQLPVWIIGGQADSSNNTVQIGGSSSASNAATMIKFFTASNTTTPTGSERMRVWADGEVEINNVGSFGGSHNASFVPVRAIDTSGGTLQYAFRAITTLTNSSSYGQEIRGLHSSVEKYGVGDYTSTIRLLSASFTAQSASLVNSVRGIVVTLTPTTSGSTITSAYGGQFNISSGSGTITAGYGVFVNTGYATTMYGIYVDNQNQGTTNYGIYTNAGLNRLGDQLTIVGSANRQQLIIQRLSTQTTNILEIQKSTGTVLSYFNHGGVYMGPIATNGANLNKMYPEQVGARQKNETAKTTVACVQPLNPNIGDFWVDLN